MTPKAIEQLTRPNGGIAKPIFLACSETIEAAEAALRRPVPASSWFNPASTPEHHVPGMAGDKGVANDFMVYRDREMGDWIANYLWANRARLGICWIIWNRRIRSTTPGKSGNWTPYSGASTHEDHVHANFGHLLGTNGSRTVAKVVYKPLSPVKLTYWVVRDKAHPNGDKFVEAGSWLWGLVDGKPRRKYRPNQHITAIRRYRDKNGAGWIVSDQNVHIREAWLRQVGT